ncbi:MAG: methylase [Candidatus Nitrosotenuis sp.]|nr:methylase [Candidatus Nitrosotenuis sp.]
MQNKLPNDTYAPSDDTFFFADCIANETGYSALEIGTGSGYLGKILQEKFSLVVGTDINYTALKSQDYKIQNSVCCKDADAVTTEFDLVICNLPYLPSETVQDVTTDGGPEGLVIPLEIISSAAPHVRPGGKLLFLTSSLANYQTLIEKTKFMGFSVMIIAKKPLFFEELIIIQATKLSF